jgi:hypothetical protein
MAPAQPDDALLLIRCPSCGQRFKVGEDLRNRTVECGGCEHRFRINDDVIVRAKKFYPGERSNPALNRFQRVPLAGGESHIGVQPVRYANVPDPAVLEPVSPQRIIAGAVGVAGMILMALLLMFGGARGGMLDGMVFSSRLLMAGFACLIGIVLLVYANPRARFKAASVGLLMGVGLMAVPFFFRVGSVPLKQLAPGPVGATVTVPAVPEEPQEDADIVALRNRIGTDPLVLEIEKLAKEESPLRAMGIWLRGLDDSNKYLVRDYIRRVTNEDPASHLYPRGNGDYLMVVTRISKTLQELADLASALGETSKIHPEISVIEVIVRNDNFVEGPIEKLSKKDDPAFYDLNKRELESIDLSRVKRAVQRLVDAEPKIYRADITRKLIALLSDDAVDFKGAVCGALANWAEEPGPAGQAAMTEVKRLILSNQKVPRDIVALIVKEKNPGIVPILDELWLKDPMEWESTYGDFGPEIEATVLRRFPETKGTVRYSAVRLLGRVGGTDSLPVLDAAASVTDPELRVLLEQARKTIGARLGQ